MKYFISEETRSAYWLDGEVLMFTPLYRNNTFDTEQDCEVDEALVGDEHIHSPDEPNPNFKTFSDLYAEVRMALNAKS